MRNDRRRQIVVDRQYQWRATLIGILYIVAVAGCMTVPLYQHMQGTKMLLLGHSPQLVQAYQEQQMHTALSIALFVIGVSAAWTFFSLIRTHKVAGPQVKLLRFFQTVATGDFTQRVQLRTGDNLQALAHGLNDMVRGLQEREQRMRDSALAQLESAKAKIVASGSSREACAVLDALAHELRYDPPTASEEAASAESDSIAADEDASQPSPEHTIPTR